MGTKTSCVGTPVPRPISNPARLASASARIAAPHVMSETRPSPHHAIAKITAHTRKPAAVTAPTTDSRSSGVLRERDRVAMTSACSPSGEPLEPEPPAFPVEPVTRGGISAGNGSR